MMFLDADDRYKDNTISRMLEIIKKFQYPDLIRFRYEKIPDGYKQYPYQDKNEKKIESENFQNEVYPMFLEGYMLNAMWLNCVKTEIVKKTKICNQNLKYGEDLLQNLELFSHIKNVVFINDILYEYIYRSGSSTTNKATLHILKKLQDAIQVYSSLHVYLKRWGMDSVSNVNLINKRIKKETDILIEELENVLKRTN